MLYLTVFTYSLFCPEYFDLFNAWNTDFPFLINEILQSTLITRMFQAVNQTTRVPQKYTNTLLLFLLSLSKLKACSRRRVFPNSHIYISAYTARPSLLHAEIETLILFPRFSSAVHPKRQTVYRINSNALTGAAVIILIMSKKKM